MGGGLRHSSASDVHPQHQTAVPLIPLRHAAHGHPPPPISDGSWELRLLVTDLQVERVLRVKSDLHVGGLMIKLVDELGKTGLITHPYTVPAGFCNLG